MRRTFSDEVKSDLEWAKRHGNTDPYDTYAEESDDDLLGRRLLASALLEIGDQLDALDERLSALESHKEPK